MIQKLTHTTIYTLDQNDAFDFYVTKLGFEVRTDAAMENGFRWLTVGPKSQPDLEIVLMPVDNPRMGPEKTKVLREAIQMGLVGGGVFSCADCRKTYEELSAKGVEFTQPPTDRFYGVEALFKDPSGVWFSLTQPKPWSA
jgi:catechol 2,3-dioxygenase-like lactoylglutathione lyase family enzyme